jgi:hypothetical protein
MKTLTQPRLLIIDGPDDDVTHVVVKDLGRPAPKYAKAFWWQRIRLSRRMERVNSM